MPCMTIQNHIRELLQGQCDSITLDLQKFPDLSRVLKNAELQAFCRKIADSKKIAPQNYTLPAIPGGRTFTAIARGRLLVNHTGGIVENSNLSLHQRFCFPVIPGSALKGIARHAATVACEGNDDLKVQFSRVFGGLENGDHDKAGSVAFLMAVPADAKWEIVVDVLTSHHGSDTKNPIPVFFPAVERGARFAFAVAPTPRTQPGDLDFAVKYLKIALQEYGVGAKTAAGYGWFEIEGETK
ncbi:MAG: type III-B CRISPR module RAMP protein Cmr6 [Victivallaceae bacterium]|nr:type III-B CRISPR module RAMP protein Cmr6 [Victivallaceae bacterium]